MRSDKCRRPGLGPVFGATGDKADVPSVGRDFQEKEGIGLRFLPGVAGRGEKRIVVGLDEKSGNADFGEEHLAARLGPVVAGVPEAIERCGEAIIEFRKGADLLDAGQVEATGELPVFGENLLLQIAHETGQVDPIVEIPEAQRAGGEVAGNGKGHRSHHLPGNLRPLFTQIFEHDVAPEAEADEDDFTIPGKGKGVGHDRSEVLAHSGMVGPQEAVGFATAAPAVPGQGVPPSFEKGRRHAPNVFGGGGAFEPVTDDGEPLISLPRPIQVQEITIFQFEALPLNQHLGSPSEKRGVDRGDMPAAQAEGGTIGGGNEGHGRGGTS